MAADEYASAVVLALELPMELEVYGALLDQA